MRRRLEMFLVAAMIAAAPSSLTMCELACAAHATPASQSQSTPRHSCHHTQSSTTTTAITGTLHACGHTDALPDVASGCSLQMSDADAASDDLLPTIPVGHVYRRLPAIAGLSPGFSAPTPLRI